MAQVNRREFQRISAAGIAGGCIPAIGATGKAAKIDETLRSGIAARKIPTAVGMVGNGKSVLYEGAFGTRDSSGVAVRMDSMFSIASMTKAITTVAALQLVEQGKIGLDEPAGKHLPALAKLQVLHGFDANGRPVLQPANKAVTLRHLVTHTSGFCYDTWDPEMWRYANAKGIPEGTPQPLMFEPGTRWQYGQGVDWTGRLVEAISGLTLEDYFQKNILMPLGMRDTSYILEPGKFDRLVSNYRRNADGGLVQDERKLPNRPMSFNGGGGLISTAGDYLKFTQMILGQGVGVNGTRVVRAATVESMEVNQIGRLGAGKMKSFRPEMSRDVDIQPGFEEKWGLGFLINTTAYAGGRSAGSLAWAGLFNTFYWIDPKRDLCAVLLMQFLPFVDPEAVGLLGDFERAVYAAL